ncbi:MAG: hypothetical protein ACREMX_04610 [Gemmatimonadales bacterium]
MVHFPRLVLLLAIAVAGCSSRDASRSAAETAAADSAARDTAAAVNPAELRIVTVMIGRQIGAEKRITEPTFQFAPKDTVYLSVATAGAPASATLGTKWVSAKGEMMDSSSQTIQPKGEEITEFHFSPARGWAVGTYKVTLYADGDSVDAKTFAVKK